MSAPTLRLAATSDARCEVVSLHYARYDQLFAKYDQRSWTKPFIIEPISEEIGFTFLRPSVLQRYRRLLRALIVVLPTFGRTKLSPLRPKYVNTCRRIGRNMRLGIPEILLTEPAPQKDDHARACASKRSIGRTGRARACCSEQMWECHTKCGRRSNLKDSPPSAPMNSENRSFGLPPSAHRRALPRSANRSFALLQKDV